MHPSRDSLLEEVFERAKSNTWAANDSREELLVLLHMKGATAPSEAPQTRECEPSETLYILREPATNP